MKIARNIHLKFMLTPYIEVWYNTATSRDQDTNSIHIYMREIVEPNLKNFLLGLTRRDAPTLLPMFPPFQCSAEYCPNESIPLEELYIHVNQDETVDNNRPRVYVLDATCYLLLHKDPYRKLGLQTEITKLQEC